MLALSQDAPKDDPLVFWTNGGPGCSGLIGYLSEHGPYRAKEDLTVEKDPYSWTKVANMLYIENPVGVGFSHSTGGPDETNPDYMAGDYSVAKDNLQLIKEFYGRFPAFAENDFYLSAESYGGHYIPTLSKIMLNDMKDDKVSLRKHTPYHVLSAGFETRAPHCFTNTCSAAFNHQRNAKHCTQMLSRAQTSSYAVCLHRSILKDSLSETRTPIQLRT